MWAVIPKEKDLDLGTRQSRKRFRERLRQWRRQRGLTQEELAKRAEFPKVGVTPFQRQDIGSRMRSRCAGWPLAVSVDYVLGRVKNPAGKDIVAGQFSRARPSSR